MHGKKTKARGAMLWVGALLAFAVLFIGCGRDPRQEAAARQRLMNAQVAAHYAINQRDAAIAQNSGQGIASNLYNTWHVTSDLRLSQAHTLSDFRAIEQQARGQIVIMQAMATAYVALHSYGTTLQHLRAAGFADDLAQAEYAQDQIDYTRAHDAAAFQHVSESIDAATVGLLNTQAQAIPYIGATLLDSFQQRITLAASLGEDTTDYAHALAADRTQLATTTSFTQYLDFQAQVTRQDGQLAVPLSRGQARQDLQQLQSLLAYCDQHSILDYEYNSGFVRTDVQNRFAQARTVQDYHAVDDATNVLVQHLRAMIANYGDTTSPSRPHAADFDLMRYDQVTSGKVIVISLREQVARAYEDGHLVMWTYVTTGRKERPSPPGLGHIDQRATGLTFTSGDPVGSSFWFAPTYVNYALQYHDGGFYIHDAWWRQVFGPGSNLPHNDPHADNGGSHGCVNVPLEPMTLLYNWTPLGTPVIVY